MFRRTLSHLKAKWQIKSNWDFFVIMVVFSLAGMMISLCRPLIFHCFGISAHTPFWIKAAVYIPFVFPVYQLSLIVFGFLLGQFPFFWEKEKKLLAFFQRRLAPAGRQAAGRDQKI